MKSKERSSRQSKILVRHKNLGEYASMLTLQGAWSFLTWSADYHCSCWTESHHMPIWSSPKDSSSSIRATVCFLPFISVLQCCPVI